MRTTNSSDATGSGSDATPTAECNRKARPPKGEPGQPAINDNRETLPGLPDRAHGGNDSMNNRAPRGTGGFRHLTGASPDLATA